MGTNQHCDVGGYQQTDDGVDGCVEVAVECCYEVSFNTEMLLSVDNSQTLELIGLK